MTQIKYTCYLEDKEYDFKPGEKIEITLDDGTTQEVIITRMQPVIWFEGVSDEEVAE